MSAYPSWWLREAERVPAALLDDWAERHAGDRDADAETDARDDDPFTEY